MGFVRRKHYELHFGPEELGGLRVLMNRCSIDVMLEVRALRAPGLITFDEANRQLNRVVELIAEHLLEWNLEDEEGASVPATLDGVRAQDRELLAEILGAWQDAVEGISAPLPKPSPSGETLVVESIPMETLSENLAS